MSVLSFFNNRQIDVKSRVGLRTTDFRVNLDHLLSRLVCREKDLHVIYGEQTMEVPPFACKFRRDSRCDLLAVANEDGDILLFDTSDAAPKSLLNTYSAHHNAIYDICWLPDHCKLITGSGDYHAAMWDMSSCKLISIFKCHSASVKSVDVCNTQSAIFATGSRDGSITVWDTREKNFNYHEKPAIHISAAHNRKNVVLNGRKSTQKDSLSSVSCVAFQDTNNLASAGVADGVVKIWDLRKTYVVNPKYMPQPRYQMQYSESKSTGHGCTSLVFDSLYKTLYACTTGNKIFTFDCHSYSKGVAMYDGFRCATYFVKLALSCDDQYLLCGSSDENAYIWKTSKPGLPILQLHGHTAEVTSVSWSPYDFTKLVTCGDDNKIAVWKISNSENISKDDIHAASEPYSESLKCASPPHSDVGQNSAATSSPALKKSPPEPIQTPNKSVKSFITNFFSPVTPSSSTVQLSPKDIQSQDANNNDSVGILSTAFSRISATESPHQVLTPCNHSNKSNIMNRSPSEISDKHTSPENSPPTNFLCSGSSKNKENSVNISPETLNKRNNIGQTKRKYSSKQSSSSSKRTHSESSNKSKGHSKTNNKSKPVTGKTITSYFSVVLSPDK